MNRFLLILYILLSPFFLFAQEVHIVPKPTSVTFKKGNFLIKEKLSYQIYGIPLDSVEIGINQLNEELQINLNTIFEKSNQADLLIGIPDKNKYFKKSAYKMDC
jgi:hypothetical protein